MESTIERKIKEIVKEKLDYDPNFYIHMEPLYNYYKGEMLEESIEFEEFKEILINLLNKKYNYSFSLEEVEGKIKVIKGIRYKLDAFSKKKDPKKYYE
jgi:hypothetical protein